MAVTINASTSAGLVQTADTSGVLALQTAGTTAVTVDASQNVGIGTASPAARLSITAGTMQSHLLLGANTSNTNYGSISLNGISADSTRLGFTGGGTGDNTLYIDVPTSGQYSFRRGGTSAMTLNSSGNLQTIGTISVGGATPSTSGAGITFPATQSASSDANTLDDYEEGTWTATDTSGASLSFTNTTQRYTKVGRLVTLQIDSLTFPSTANGNSVAIGGLPFTAASAGSAGSGGITSYTGSVVQFFVVGGASELRLYNVPSAFSRTTNANMSGLQLYTSITYSV